MGSIVAALTCLGERLVLIAERCVHGMLLLALLFYFAFDFDMLSGFGLWS